MNFPAGPNRPTVDTDSETWWTAVQGHTLMVNACQARIISDIEVVAEPVPDQVSIAGRVTGLARLAPDVVGVDLDLPKPFRYLPGQFCKLQFQGFPARCYSPTYPLEGRPSDRGLHFHIRRFCDGAVSSRLGHEIQDLDDPERAGLPAPAPLNGHAARPLPRVESA